MYSSYAVTAAVCSCVFPVLAAIAVAVRFWAKLMASPRLASDDWLILLALLVSTSICCLVGYDSFKGGVGQPMSTITPEEFTKSQKHLFAGILLGHLDFGLVKLALLQFYKHLFTTPAFRLSANIMFAIVVLFIVSATITQLLCAMPISNFWTFGKPFVINYGAFISSFAAIDLFLDVIILLMPLPVIRALHISRKKKYLIIGVFWMGGFCVVASTMRFYFGFQLSRVGTGRPVSDDYFSYLSVNSTIWGEIEGCSSIIAACLPTYGPIARNIKVPEFLASPFRSLTSRRSKSKESKPTSANRSKTWLELSDSSQKNLTPMHKGQSDEVLLEHALSDNGHGMSEPPAMSEQQRPYISRISGLSEGHQALPRYPPSPPPVLPATYQSSRPGRYQ